MQTQPTLPAGTSSFDATTVSETSMPIDVFGGAALGMLVSETVVASKLLVLAGRVG
jgi:hypothetical protein